MLSRWQSTIVDAKGNIQPSAVLRILNEADQSLALVYQTNNDLQPYPLGYVTANANGFAYFYAAPGRYRIQSVDLDIDWRDVEIGGLAIARTALENSGMSIYDTHAGMLADAPAESPVYARVVNDVDPELNGYYIWDGSTWSRTTEQPADADKVLRNDIPQAAPLLYDIPQSGVVQLPSDIDFLRTVVNNIMYGNGPRPSLDLQFAGATMLDPRVEFTRASTATYTDAMGEVRTAGVDEPRFDYDPVTGEPLGVLIEPGATNLISNSESSSADGVTLLNTTLEPSYITSPSGTGNFLYLRENTASGVHQISFAVPPTLPETDYTFSLYIHKLSVGSRNFTIYPFNASTAGGTAARGATFSSAGEFLGYQGAGTDPDHYIQDFGDYYRVCVTGKTGDGGAGAPTVRLGSSAYEGDGNSGLYYWGAQFEEGTRPTSYIPTSGSPVTRAADSGLVVPVSGLLPSDEVTFGIEFYLPSNATSSGYTNLITLRDSSIGNSNHASLLFRSNRWGSISRNYGLGETTWMGMQFGPGNLNRGALSFSKTDSYRSTNGTVRRAGNGGGVGLSMATTLHAGSRAASFANAGFIGHVSRMYLYPRVMTEAELIELTTINEEE